MEWNETLQCIIDYVEHHLQKSEEPLNPQEIAKIAECSFSFFQKIFSYMNNISFSEYVRARKLTLAGYELKSTNHKVIEIALQFGYDSPTSFTKAFQQFHGVTPKEARRPNVRLQIVPKMQINEHSRYAWRVESMPSMHLLGPCKNFHKQHSLAQAIPAFWQECKDNGTYAQLIHQSHQIPKGIFGLFLSSDTKQSTQDYAIMVPSHNACPNGWMEITLPPCTWAIFDCYGPKPQAIQRCWHFLEQEWLLHYPFQHAPYPEMEWYCEEDALSFDSHAQIWIPILDSSHSSS